MKVSLLARLKERKLVQWTVAYLAGAWVVLQVLDVLAGLYVGVLLVVGAGFLVTLVLAWYHGEKGRQRVGLTEVISLVAVLGLTFKPNTDDMRDAPSISVIAALQDQGARVRAYDPVGIEQARLVLEDVDYADSAYACAEGADALVIVTEWEQFRALDLSRLKGLMRQPIVVDLRNIYRAEEMARHGFTHVGVGVPARS